jgi:predicted ATPase
MKIEKFEIKNFKGINEAEIRLADEVPGNVVTLIGLNESGKTTLLEAISNFISDDPLTSSLVKTVQRRPGLQDIIPKDKKAAFTGEISIAATIQVDDDSVDELAKFLLKKHQLILSKSKFDKTFEIMRKIVFEDSVYKEASHIWDFSILCSGVKSKKAKIYFDADDKVWLDAVDFLQERLPQIVYFPTLLFNFPNRIYLEEKHIQSPNKYYAEIMQSILSSSSTLTKKLDIKTHIIDRVEKVRKSSSDSQKFFSQLMMLNEKEQIKDQIDAVVHTLSIEVTKVVFGSWAKILGRKVSNQRVQVDWSVDVEKENTPYLQFSIIDGASRYALSERSLGFRWFFSFLLFTQFRVNGIGRKSTIFLFDEPATNLHSRAQIKLLDSFSKIVNNNTFVIFSTHSHYMINPLYLEKAYIVENKGIDFDAAEDLDSFPLRNTDVRATKYRHFVAQNPGKTTYFQPVLDALAVGPSPLEAGDCACVVEGKYDFHPVLYFREILGYNEKIKIYPGCGASTSGALTMLLRGWGFDFCILLDDDRAGREAAKRYVQDFLVRSSQIITTHEVDSRFSGKPFEELYQSDVRSAVATHFGIAPSAIKKNQFSIYFQHLIFEKKNVYFPDTQVIFKKLLEAVIKAFTT